MEQKAPPYHWVDHLSDKHECFKYSEVRTATIVHDGRVLRVNVPDWADEFTPLTVSQAGDVLTIIGQLAREYNGKPLGVMLAAVRRTEDEYEVGIWHELYPWALKHLGLVPTTAG